MTQRGAIKMNRRDAMKLFGSVIASSVAPIAAASTITTASVIGPLPPFHPNCRCVVNAIGADGGFFIPGEYATPFMNALDGEIRRRAVHIPMSGSRDAAPLMSGDDERDAEKVRRAFARLHERFTQGRKKHDDDSVKRKSS